MNVHLIATLLIFSTTRGRYKNKKTIEGIICRYGSYATEINKPNLNLKKNITLKKDTSRLTNLKVGPFDGITFPIYY